MRHTAVPIRHCAGGFNYGATKRCAGSNRLAQPLTSVNVMQDVLLGCITFTGFDGIDDRAVCFGRSACRRPAPVRELLHGC